MRWKSIHGLLFLRPHRLLNVETGDEVQDLYSCLKLQVPGLLYF